MNGLSEAHRMIPLKATLRCASSYLRDSRQLLLKRVASSCCCGSSFSHGSRLLSGFSKTFCRSVHQLVIVSNIVLNDIIGFSHLKCTQKKLRNWNFNNSASMSSNNLTWTHYRDSLLLYSTNTSTNYIFDSSTFVCFKESQKFVFEGAKRNSSFINVSFNFDFF